MIFHVSRIGRVEIRGDLKRNAVIGSWKYWRCLQISPWLVVMQGVDLSASPLLYMSQSHSAYSTVQYARHISPPHFYSLSEM